jgi:hypothetical protein
LFKGVITMKSRHVVAIALALATALLLVAALTGSRWGQGAMYASIGYGILVSLFLAAQLWGFVSTQTSYVKDVERVKYQVLEVEGISECEE